MSRILSAATALLVVLLTALGVTGVTVAVADSPGTLTITPRSFAFGPINVGGELGEPGEFTLTNNSSEIVRLDDAFLNGPDMASFKLLPNGSTCYWLEPAGVILPGASCTVVAIFDPESEGSKQADLHITSSSTTSPDVLPLSGTGLPRLLPGATVTPQVLDFGGQPVGGAAATREITLTSSGSGDLVVSGPLLIGSGGAQFRIASQNCSGRSIASGDSCKLKVEFEPGSVGDFNAKLTIPTDADGADTTVDLSGSGVTGPALRSSRVRVGAVLPRLRLAGTQVIPIDCATSNMDLCRGQITVKAGGRALGMKHNRPILLGSRSYAIPAGKSMVRVRLIPLALRQVRRNGRLPVMVLAGSRQGDGSIRSIKVERRIRR